MPACGYPAHAYVAKVSWGCLLGITPHDGFLRYRGHSHREALDVLPL